VLTEKDFTFQHLESDDDVEQHLELMRRVFGQNARIDLQVKKWMDHHPAMTLKDFFVIKNHGKIVACLNIIPSKWSIGGIEFKVSELGCVATLPECRHQGLQKWLHGEYHKQLLEQDYDLSAIEGIPKLSTFCLTPSGSLHGKVSISSSFEYPFLGSAVDS
jgi:predicted N-acetyltransferase YhbS